ncbi:MAG: basic amino acid ABC transporter substrate-binding protein [Spirochaetia bacterium]
MKKITILLLAVVLSISMFTGCGEDSDTIIVASDATWPPMEFINEDQELVGFDIELMNAIADAAEFELEIQNTAWDGIFAGLGNNQYDAIISSVTITEERDETMDFSIPYLNAGQVLIVRQDTSGVDSLEDMEGRTVGAQIGTTGAIVVGETDGIELRTYDELGLAIQDLASDRIDGVVADTPIAADYVLQNDTYSDTLQIVGEPFTEEYYGIAVKEGNSEVLDEINRGLRIVIEDGTLDELIDKWLR